MLQSSFLTLRRSGASNRNVGKISFLCSSYWEPLPSIQIKRQRAMHWVWSVYSHIMYPRRPLPFSDSRQWSIFKLHNKPHKEIKKKACDRGTIVMINFNLVNDQNSISIAVGGSVGWTNLTVYRNIITYFRCSHMKICSSIGVYD